ncbi:MAG: TPM domain-containing protein [Oscillospiraceae bacterium]|nr:TPM domain-containing protein [Oscillospiraceae bacterium]
MHNAHNAKSILHKISRAFLILIAFTATFTAMILSPMLSVNVNAYTEKKVYDYGDLLTDREESRIEEQLRKASENCGHDIIVYTVKSLGGNSVSEYSQRAADGINTDSDGSGILYLVSINDREYDIYAFGEMYERIMSDRELNRLADDLRSYLSEGDYYGAFSEFGKRVEKAALNNEDYSGNISVRLTLSFSTLIVSAFIALIIVFCMKQGMKTTRPEITAGNYVKNGSFKVTVSRDVYLYTSVSRVRIQSNNNGHRSGGGHHSGGRSSGGHHSGGHRSGGHSRGRF